MIVEKELQPIMTELRKTALEKRTLLKRCVAVEDTFSSPQFQLSMMTLAEEVT